MVLRRARARAAQDEWLGLAIRIPQHAVAAGAPGDDPPPILGVEARHGADGTVAVVPLPPGTHGGLRGPYAYAAILVAARDEVVADGRQGLDLGRMVTHTGISRS